MGPTACFAFLLSSFTSLIAHLQNISYKLHCTEISKRGEWRVGRKERSRNVIHSKGTAISSPEEVSTASESPTGHPNQIWKSEAISDISDKYEEPMQA